IRPSRTPARARPLARALFCAAVAVSSSASPGCATPATSPRGDEPYLSPMPEPLVRVPLRSVREPSGDSPPGRRELIKLLVGTDGFVTATAWPGGVAPRDSSAVVRRMRRWIFRPAREDGSRAAVATWVAVAV